MRFACTQGGPDTLNSPQKSPPPWEAPLALRLHDAPTHNYVDGFCAAKWQDFVPVDP